MKTLKNSGGFSAVHALLILLVIGILGFTGWYVWSANKEASDNLTFSEATLSKNASSNKKSDAKAPIPAGYVKYTNDKYGFSFYYPEAWGNVTVDDRDTSKLYVLFTASDGQVSPYNIQFHAKNMKHVDTDSPTANLVDYALTNKNVVLYHAEDMMEPTTINSTHVLKSVSHSVIYSQELDTGNQTITGLKHVKVSGSQIAVFAYTHVATNPGETNEIVTTLQNLINNLSATN